MVGDTSQAEDIAQCTFSHIPVSCSFNMSAKVTHDLGSLDLHHPATRLWSRLSYSAHFSLLDAHGLERSDVDTMDHNCLENAFFSRGLRTMVKISIAFDDNTGECDAKLLGNILLGDIHTWQV